MSSILSSIALFFAQSIVLNLTIALLVAWSVWFLYRLCRWFFGDYLMYKWTAYERLRTLSCSLRSGSEPSSQTMAPAYVLWLVARFSYFHELERDFILVFPGRSFAKVLHFFLCVLLVLFFIIALFSFSVLFALFCVFVLVLFIVAYLKFRIAGVQSAITLQIPDTLSALSNALQAGYSFPQAIEFVERESVFPLQPLLSFAVHQLRYNFSLDQVLTNMKKRARNTDLTLVFDGILMQLHIGGNLHAMMKRQAQVIRERLTLERDIKSATAQGRMAGVIVALLWPISLALFYFLSPDYVEILFVHPVGQLLLGLAVFFEAIGFFIIWKIAYVKL